MRRHRFWFNIPLLIVPPFLIGTGTVVLVRRIWTYLNTDARLAGLLSTEASRALGREVHVGAIRFRSSPWSLLPNRVELSDISIAQYPTLNSALFAHADKVTVWYDVNQILFPKDGKVPLVREVQVVGPLVNLSRDAQGNWNFEQIFKPTGATGRPFTDKLSFQNASLNYSDLSFPHPPEVPRRPFAAHLRQVSGVVLVRPDKSVAFDVGGKPDPSLLSDFHATGTGGLTPLRVNVHVIAHRINLALIAERFVPSKRGHLRSGTADVDFSALYAPPSDTSLNSIDLNALQAHGTMAANGVSLTAPQLDEPLHDASIKGAFTTDSFSGSVGAMYAGVAVTAQGQAVGLLKREVGANGKPRIVATLPAVSLEGRASQIDVARLIRALHLNERLAQYKKITPAIRQRIVATTGHVRGVTFQLEGALSDPAVSLAAHVDSARSFGFGAQDVEARAVLDRRIVTADVRGKAEGGDIAARARVLTQEPGTFDVEAHGRNVPLAALRTLIKRDISGQASLDLAMRGRRGQTPFISAQAQAANIRLNGQTIRSAYLRAATVGGNLIVRQARIDDAKGFALVTGAVDLKTQALKLNAAADNLDLHALAAALLPAKQKEGANPASGIAASLPTDLPPLFDPNALQGQAFFRGRVEGTLSSPEVSGRVSAFGIQAGQASLDRVITDFSLSKQALVIGKGLAERYPGLVTFSGRATDLMSGDPAVQLRASAVNVDIPDLLRLAGAQSMRGANGPAADTPKRSLDAYVITGALSAGPVELQGRLKTLRLAQPVTVTGEGVSVNGLPVTNLKATAVLNEGKLELQTAQADVAGGTLTASGTLNNIADQLDSALNLRVSAMGLDASKLTEALPPAVLPLNVTGTLNLQAEIHGSPRRPDVNADADLRRVLLTDEAGGVIDVGDVRASAAYVNGQVKISSAAVSEAGAPAGTVGAITLEQIAYDPKSRAISGVARWNELRLQRLRELFNKSPFALRGPGLQAANALRSLARPITGSLSGQARLAGTLDKPTADIAWNATPIQIEDHTITTFSGSAFVDSGFEGKGKITIPSPSTPDQIVRLQSDDIDVDIPTVSAVLQGGPLEADVRANKLNLEFVHHFLPLPAKPTAGQTGAAAATGTAAVPTFTVEQAADIAQNISGGGTAEIVASGTTDSPVLDASINLRNVKYRDPLSRTDQVINRIDVSHLTVKEGKIDTDIIQIAKTGTLPDGKQQGRFEANARGSVDFSWKPPFIQKNANFDVTANVPEQSLEVLSLFGQNLNITSDGRFSLRAHVFNTLDKYRIFGALTLDASRLQFGTVQTGLYRTGLRDIRGQIDFRNDSIAIHDGFTARTQVFGKSQLLGYDPKAADTAQTGTPIQLTGSLPLREVGGEGIRLRADRILFNETPLPGSHTGKVRGEAGINLTLTGSVMQPTLGGLVSIVDTAAAPPTDFGGAGGGALPLPINPNFDLLIRLGKNVRVENSQLNARVEGNVSIKGPLYVDAGNAVAPTPVSPSTLLSTNNSSTAAAAPIQTLGLKVLGKLTIPEGRLTLPTARFTILPPGDIMIAYPSPDASANGLPTLGIDVNLRARTSLTATSLAGVRKRYVVTVAARGPITGATLDPRTGDSRLALNFTTDPNDLATSQYALQQRLAGVLGGDALGQFGRNPGQVVAQQLTNVLTSAVIPSVFDNFARATGFEQLEINYDPVQRLNLTVSRQLFGPLYFTYNRSLGGTTELYDLKLSLRFKDRYQLSYEQNETNEQRTLLEGIWHF